MYLNRSKSKWRVILPIILVISLLGAVMLSGCGGAPKKEDSKPEAAKDPVKIGMTSALTGPYSEFGEGNRRGVVVAVEQWNRIGGINGRKIELITRDDQLDPNKAVINMKELLEKEKVVAIIGPAGSGPAMATVPLCEAKNIPFINTIAQTPAIIYPKGVTGQDPRPNAFTAAIQNDVEAVAAAKFLAGNWNKIGLMHESTTYGSTGIDIIWKKLEAEYGKIPVGREQYDQKDPDMTAQLARLQKKGAEVIFVIGLGADTAAIRKDMNRLGLSIPLVGSMGIFSQPYREIAGDLAVGTIGTCKMDWAKAPPTREIALKYKEDYLKIWGHDRWWGPDEWPDPQFANNTQAYDAAIVLFEAIKRANSTEGQKIIDELNKLKDFPCIGLNFSFSKDKHHAVEPEHLGIFVLSKDGNKIVLKPYEGAVKK